MLLRFNDSALLREWTVQKSLIVVRTHLALVSGKLVLQKDAFSPLRSSLLGPKKKVSVFGPSAKI